MAVILPFMVKVSCRIAAQELDDEKALLSNSRYLALLTKIVYAWSMG